MINNRLGMMLPFLMAMCDAPMSLTVRHDRYPMSGGVSSERKKSQLTGKQRKRRLKSKRAKLSRRKNR